LSNFSSKYPRDLTKNTPRSIIEAMNNLNATIKPISETNLLKAILAEIHLLRNDLSLFFGEDDLENYAHPERIRRSHQEALNQYPIKL